MSNPAQNRTPDSVILDSLEVLFVSKEEDKVGLMEPVSHPLRSRFRRRLAFMTDMFWKLLAIFRPPAREVRSTRMCPFCGLITSRAKRCCLECGKALQPV